MSSITLYPRQLASIASILVAASKDDVTPVIVSAHIRVQDGFLTAVATDRYRVARVTFPLTSDEGDTQDDLDVVVPRAFLERFARTVKAAKLKPDAKISLSHDPLAKSLTFAFSGGSASDVAITGNYPPVARLFPEAESLTEVGEIALNPRFVSDAGKLDHPTLTADDLRNGAVRLRFTKSGRADKPGPVLIDRRGIRPKDGGLEYLLQPNLLLR